MVLFIVAIGAVASLVAAGVGLVAYLDGDPHWQTLLFTTLVFAQLGLALGVRSEQDSLLTIGLGSNRAMLGAILLMVVLQLAVVYVPFFQTVFGTAALPPQELLIPVLAGVVVLLAVEVWKWAIRLRSAPRGWNGGDRSDAGA